MTAKLSINLNKIALLRNQRNYGIPSVIDAAVTCIDAGCAGITIHPRPDERHIRTHDVYDLAELLKDHPTIEYNIEGNPFEGRFMQLVADVRPDQATLVPDDPAQATSDHGWNITQNNQRLIPIIQTLKDQGVRVSVFMDPDVQQITQVPTVHADRIELYTESYAAAFRAGDPESVLAGYVQAAECAEELGLGINAGHDLNLQNLPMFCKQIPRLLEVSIGHEITADAIQMGLTGAVKAYRQALSL